MNKQVDCPNLAVVEDGMREITGPQSSLFTIKVIYPLHNIITYIIFVVRLISQFASHYESEMSIINDSIDEHEVACYHW